MKSFVGPNIFQHNRLFRLVILVIIIGLTIFLYTSYYANSTIDRQPISQRFHFPSMISVSSIIVVDSSNNANRQNSTGDLQMIYHDDSIDSKDISKKILNSSNDPYIKLKIGNDNLSDILSNSFSDDSLVQRSNLIEGQSEFAQIKYNRCCVNRM